MTGLREVLGLDVVRLEADAAEVEMVADDRHLNEHGTVHGGAIATLVDTAMGSAVFREDTEDDAPVTIEMKVTYLEPARPGRLRATATVKRRGQRIIIAEVDVTDDEGTAVAHGIGTFTSV
ncbi:MAG: PaaI family thioesterase [Acidimicrobiales bacterium]|nr:PaaI family thioesterase [Acidimicrobiales bacterium]